LAAGNFYKNKKVKCSYCIDFLRYRCAAVQTDQTGNASRVQTEYPLSILQADIPFARLTHH
jgi:hypothetical protein